MGYGGCAKKPLLFQSTELNMRIKLPTPNPEEPKILTTGHRI